MSGIPEIDMMISTVKEPFANMTAALNRIRDARAFFLAKVGWVSRPALAGFPSEQSLLGAVDRQNYWTFYQCIQREPFQQPKPPYGQGC